MMDTRQIIALQEIKGCGAATIRQLVSEAQKSRHNNLSDSDFYEFVNKCISTGIKRCRIKSIGKFELLDAISSAEKILEKSERLGIKTVSYIDPFFPKHLLKTVNEDGKPDVPLVLFYKGDLSVLKRKGIAIIGTRIPTLEGLSAGEYLGEKLAEAGYNIVSGLAIGCDSAGHRGALKAPNGITTAFLAHGLDSVYPPENERLAEEIVERGGLLMSEYPVGETVNKYFLVARDRLQAALSSATIVIQTGLTGGTFHAANTTLILGKPLFCVKYGSETLMRNEKVEGNTALVSKGAKFITSSDFMTLISSYLGAPYEEDTINESASKANNELLLFSTDEL
jgi:DNA processing protein